MVEDTTWCQRLYTLLIIWLGVLSSYLTRVAILSSQAFNTLIGGSPYEMTSSRAWRLRNDYIFWKFIQLFLDNVPPLSWWRYPDMTHCESCFYAENSRFHSEIFKGLKK